MTKRGTIFGKKGQVTVFIILGLVILILAVSISYLKNESFREKIQGGLFKSSVVPEQAQGITNFVSNCIQDIATDGIEIIGLQGGYIDIPVSIKNDPTQNLDIAGIRVPYWLYGESNIGNIPSNDAIENQLKSYIEKGFREECNLNTYTEQGYTISRRDIEVDVDLNDKGVSIRLNSDLNAEIKETKYNLRKYISVDIPSKLKIMRDMGKDIVEREGLNAPLEFNTINLIAIYSRYASEEIPPMAGMEFKCGSKKWIIPQVKEVLRNIIAENSVKLRIDRTDSEYFDDEFYNTMRLDLRNNYEDIAPQFEYSTNWPFYLDINPSKGMVVEGKDMKLANIPILPILCIKNYDFKYDIKYPLLVNLLSGDEIFRFVIGVDIKDNYGRRRAFNIDTEVSQIKSLICEEGQRLSGEVFIEAYDAKEDIPLSDVDVMFNCVEHYCEMGKTLIDNTGLATYSSRFPLCNEGELILSKDDYLPYREKISTYAPELELSNTVSANLEPYRNQSARIKVYDAANNELVGRDLVDGEVAVVQINRYNDIFEDYDYRTTLVFENSSAQEFQIVPAENGAEYEIQINLVTNNLVHIPEKNIDGNLIPAMDLEEGTVIGGANYQWILRGEGAQGIDNNNEIIFYALSNGIPDTYDELSEGMSISERSSEFGDELTPTLRNVQ